MELPGIDCGSTESGRGLRVASYIKLISSCLLYVCLEVFSVYWLVSIVLCVCVLPSVDKFVSFLEVLVIGMF